MTILQKIDVAGFVLALINIGLCLPTHNWYGICGWVCAAIGWANAYVYEKRIALYEDYTQKLEDHINGQEK